jgi:hypothetical protein
MVLRAFVGFVPHTFLSRYEQTIGADGCSLVPLLYAPKNMGLMRLLCCRRCLFVLPKRRFMLQDMSLLSYGFLQV